MSGPIAHLPQLLRTMEPRLHDGVYAYCVVPHGTDVGALTVVATVAEAEGLTIVVPEAQALQAGLPVHFRAAWITLTVHSDLNAVGLTAAFAGALARAGIGCNVVAGALHDHLFVPVQQAEPALAALRALQHDARADGPVPQALEPARRHVHVWEYTVPAAQVPAFVATYGPDGAWAALFRRAEGYLETLLLQDPAQPGRYLTIDRWASAAAYDAFRARFGAEYEALDRACEALTEHEASLGTYGELAGPSAGG